MRPRSGRGCHRIERSPPEKYGPIYAEPPGDQSACSPATATLPYHNTVTTERKPYRLITTDDPCRTFGQGDVRYFDTLIAAANAFFKAAEPYRTIIHDNGHLARELNRAEWQLVENVAAKLGYEVEGVEG